MKRGALGSLLAALATAGFLTASVLAGPQPLSGQTESTTDPTETTTTETTAPPPAPPPAKPKPKPKAARLPARVTVGGVHVGGLTPEVARQVVRLAFAAPLVLALDGKRLSVSPRRLGAEAYIKPAVARALHAAPGAKVPLFVTVRGSAVRSYVQTLKRKYDRKVRDAQVVLRRLSPRIVEERPGLQVRKGRTVAAIVQALRENRRGPVPVQVRTVRPALRETFFKSVVVILRSSKALRYYRGEKLARIFKVAVGQPAYPTPLGKFRIVVLWRNPWWYPPPSPWATGSKPVPPGPGNPLGTRWMGISAPYVGIHGTPDAASLGYSASHGCIRMAIPSAEWLFNRVQIGTPVFIVDA